MLETLPTTAPPATRSTPLPGGRELRYLARPLVMGVVNITPDSFSDGGLWLEPEHAVAHGLALLAEGADLLDLGAESTRPGGGVYGAGARDVPAEEEASRLLPVLTALRAATDKPLSVDTRKPAVARQAITAGADLINDVSCLADRELAVAVAASECALILMHSRGELASMQKAPRYADLAGEVRGELAGAVERAVDAGVEPRRLLIDPGIGFAKTYEHNLGILGNLDFLAPLGLPRLVGASRKSFIGQLTGGAPPTDRLAGSLAAVAWAAAARVEMVRVHDVRETVRFLAVWQAVADRAGGPAAR